MVGILATGHDKILGSALRESCPGGTFENSPRFQPWGPGEDAQSPEGTAENRRRFSRPFGTRGADGISRIFARNSAVIFQRSLGPRRSGINPRIPPRSNSATHLCTELTCRSNASANSCPVANPHWCNWAIARREMTRPDPSGLVSTRKCWSITRSFGVGEGEAVGGHAHSDPSGVGDPRSSIPPTPLLELKSAPNSAMLLTMANAKEPETTLGYD